MPTQIPRRTLVALLLVGLPMASLHAQGSHPARNHDGHQQVAWPVPPAEVETWELGTSFDVTGDLNADAMPDLLILYNQKYGESRPSRVTAISGTDGAVLWFVGPAELGGWRFSHVSTWMDSNADGVPDVLVAVLAPGAAYDGPRLVSILSGKTGELLYSPKLPQYWSGPIVMGYSWDPVDVYGRRLRGFVLEALVRSGDAGELSPHHVRAWSAEPEEYEWDRLRIHSFDAQGTRVSDEIDAPEGVRFRGRARWAVGQPEEEPSHILCLTKSPQEQVLRLALLRRIRAKGEECDWRWCRSPGYRIEVRSSVGEAALVGDVNGDGVVDVVVALSRVLRPGARSRVVLLCGASGQPLMEFVDGTEQDRTRLEGYGTSLALLGDLNHDGGTEFAVSSIDAGSWAGHLSVHDPSSGEMRGVVRGGFDLNRMGTVLKAGRDFDGDWVPDYVASEDPFNNGKNLCPRLHIYSGATHELIRSLP